MAGMHKRRLARRNSPGGELHFGRRFNRPITSSDNKILAGLPPEESGRLRPYLELVSLRAGSVLWEANQPIEFVYFPTAGMGFSPGDRA